MLKVIHLIPYDGIGGVEVAARTMSGWRSDAIDFRLRYLFPHVSDRTQRGRTFNIWRIFVEAIAIVAEKPDVLIVSLWRAAIAGILVRLLSSETRLIVFIHNSKDAHIIDAFITRCAIWLSHEVWSDSAASLKQRFSKPLSRPIRTISFLAYRIEPNPEPKLVAPTFAFWGRLAVQKNLPRALHLFAKLRHHYPNATYMIIGPDGDDAIQVRALIDKLELSESVRLLGTMDFSEICACVSNQCFYLQTSHYEGMAMSVVEAMQLGLVPVVTPVGEIESYCEAGINSVVVQNDDQALSDLLKLIESPKNYLSLRSVAMQRWKDQLLYRESMANTLNIIAPLKHGF